MLYCSRPECYSTPKDAVCICQKPILHLLGALSYLPGAVQPSGRCCLIVARCGMKPVRCCTAFRQIPFGTGGI